MAGLVRLIYSSSLTEAGRASGEGVLPDILAKAVRNNGLLGVSGMLLAFGDGFLQVLEGSPAAVDAVLIRVRDDRRHREVKILERTGVIEREFGRWAMCGRALSSADNAILDVLALKPGFKPQAVTGRDGLKQARAA